MSFCWRYAVPQDAFRPAAADTADPVSPYSTSWIQVPAALLGAP